MTAEVTVPLRWGPTWLLTRATTDVSLAMAWTSGSVEFEEATLAEVIRDVTRYTSNQFEVADTSLGEIRLSGRSA